MGSGVANATLTSLWPTEGGYGSLAVPDWVFNIPPEPFSAFPSEATLRASGYARSWRMSPPVAECSFDSTSLGGRTSRGDRRCRLSYGSLGSLLSPPGYPAVPATLHAEVRQDACGGAALGSAVNPLGSSTFSAAAAAAGLPTVSLHAASSLLTLARPTMCSSNADCGGAAGFSCVDIEADLVGGDLGAALPRKLQNMFAALVVGPSTDSSSPSASVGAFKRSLRTIIRALGGARADGGQDLKVCMPAWKAIAKDARAWERGAMGSHCSSSGCLDLPATPGVFPLMRPAELPGFADLPLAPDVHPAPDAASGMFAPFAPDGRTQVPGSLSSNFIVTLVPADGGAGVTNAVKARLRRALVWALSGRGYPVQSSEVLITSVVSRGGGLADVAFTVSLPIGTDASVLTALIAELTSGTPGSIGASAGAALATLGLVRAADAATVALRIASPSPSPAAAAQGSPSASASPPGSPTSTASTTATTTNGVSASASAVATPSGSATPVPTRSPVVVAGGVVNADSASATVSGLAAVIGLFAVAGVAAIIVLRRRGARVSGLVGSRGSVPPVGLPVQAPAKFAIAAAVGGGYAPHHVTLSPHVKVRDAGATL